MQNVYITCKIKCLLFNCVYHRFKFVFHRLFTLNMTSIAFVGHKFHICPVPLNCLPDSLAWTE